MNVPHLEPGRIVGQRYTIRRLVAASRTSSIYDAITAPNRELFFEVFSPAIGAAPETAAHLARIAAEVNALPTSIVLPIVEAAIDEETRCPFIASDASVTPALDELVKLCPLAGDELVAFVARLCAALDAIHSRNLVHGALDPTKVFVGPAPRCDVRLAGGFAALLSGTSASGADDVRAAAILTFYAATGMKCEDTVTAVAAPPPGFDARLEEPLSRVHEYASAGELGRAVTVAFGSSFVVSSPWLAAAPPVPDVSTAPGREPLPPAVPSMDPTVSWPIDSRAPHARSANRSPLKTIIVVAGALLFLLVGGIAIAFVFSGGGRHRKTEPVASAPASTAPVEPPSATAEPPQPSSAPAVTASASASAPPMKLSPSEATLIVTCTPECDAIFVDGKRVVTFPAKVKTGPHNIAARRGYHPPQYRFVQLPGGVETKIAFVWKQAPPKKP